MIKNKRIRISISMGRAKEIMEHFKNKGFKVELKNIDNFHMVITGEKRVVNFYPSTGTIQCNPAKGLKPFKLIGAKPETALLRVADIARHGY